jgi:hypothetical protein
MVLQHSPMVVQSENEEKTIVRNTSSFSGSTMSTKYASKLQLVAKMRKNASALRSKWATWQREIGVIFTWMAPCATHGHQNRKKQVPGLQLRRKVSKIDPHY